jgi:hypothetical protein
MTPEMRHQRTAIRADQPGAMGEEEITLEDLMDEEPASAAAPATFEQLLADGFPRQGGMAALVAISQMQDPGARMAPVQLGYQQILRMQTRAKPQR